MAEGHSIQTPKHFPRPLPSLPSDYRANSSHPSVHSLGKNATKCTRTNDGEREREREELFSWTRCSVIPIRVSAPLNYLRCTFNLACRLRGRGGRGGRVSHGFSDRFTHSLLTESEERVERHILFGSPSMDRTEGGRSTRC